MHEHNAVIENWPLAKITPPCPRVLIARPRLVQSLDTAVREGRLIEPGGYLEWCDSLWATAERSRITRQALTVALTLAQIYDHLGRCEDAIAACRRAIALDPFDEAPRLALLNRLGAAGHLGAARREYTAFRQLLREEIALEPSAELRDFAARLIVNP